MKLPGADTAVVDIVKLRDYCLNPVHPRGKHKAKVFFDALGLTAVNAALLQNAIQLGIRDADATIGRQDQYGQRYWADLDLTILSRTARVRTAWIIRTGETSPRLTTCYVL